MDTVSPTVAWAQSYGAVGWRCFPVVPGGKRPMYAGWQRDATTDPDALARWFADESRNIGVVCGETFDAFDIEAAHLVAFAALIRSAGASLPRVPVASTGRGGMHILVRPTGADGTRRLYLDGVHVGELKSRGGFIVVAPSMTDGEYSWRYAPAGMALAAAPDWLAALVAKRPAFADKPVRKARSADEARRGLEALARVVAAAGSGDRNNVLYWAGVQAAREGSSPGAIAVALASGRRCRTHQGRRHGRGRGDATERLSDRYGAGDDVSAFEYTDADPSFKPASLPTVAASGVQTRTVKWLWQDWIPLSVTIAGREPVVAIRVRPAEEDECKERSDRYRDEGYDGYEQDDRTHRTDHLRREHTDNRQTQERQDCISAAQQHQHGLSTLPAARQAPALRIDECPADLFPTRSAMPSAPAGDGPGPGLRISDGDRRLPPVRARVIALRSPG